MTHSSLSLCNSHPPSLHLEPSPQQQLGDTWDCRTVTPGPMSNAGLVLLPGMVALSYSRYSGQARTDEISVPCR